MHAVESETTSLFFDPSWVGDGCCRLPMDHVLALLCGGQNVQLPPATITSFYGLTHYLSKEELALAVATLKRLVPQGGQSPVVLLSLRELTRVLNNGRLVDMVVPFSLSEVGAALQRPAAQQAMNQVLQHWTELTFFLVRGDDSLLWGVCSRGGVGEDEAEGEEGDETDGNGAEEAGAEHDEEQEGELFDEQDEDMEPGEAEGDNVAFSEDEMQAE
jgi:hypothetical protein